MPYGLQTFGSNGVLRLDITDNLTRIVGYLQISTTASGSIQLPEGRPFYQVVPTGTSNPGGIGYYQPAITISGTTLSYAPSSDRGAAVACTLIYGVY